MRNNVLAKLSCGYRQYAVAWSEHSTLVPEANPHLEFDALCVDDHVSVGDQDPVRSLRRGDLIEKPRAEAHGHSASGRADLRRAVEPPVLVPQADSLVGHVCNPTALCGPVRAARKPY